MIFQSSNSAFDILLTGDSIIVLFFKKWQHRFKIKQYCMIFNENLIFNTYIFDWKV